MAGGTRILNDHPGTYHRSDSSDGGRRKVAVDCGTEEEMATRCSCNVDVALVVLAVIIISRSKWKRKDVNAKERQSIRLGGD